MTDYDSAEDARRSYTTAIRAIRLQCIAAGQIEPDEDNPEEVQAYACAQSGKPFDLSTMKPVKHD